MSKAYDYSGTLGGGGQPGILRGDDRLRVVPVWPRLSALLGAVALAPGFPLADISRTHPFARSLLPYIAAFCAGWALLAATLIRARLAHKISREITP